MKKKQKLFDQAETKINKLFDVEYIMKQLNMLDLIIKMTLHPE
jgi:hypothetical protein